MKDQIPIRSISLYILVEGDDFPYPAEFPKDLHLLSLLKESVQMESGVSIRRTGCLDEADFVVFPYLLDSVYAKSGLLGIYRFVRCIRDFEKIARRTVFFFSDDLPFEFSFPSIFVRRSADTQLNGENTIASPYIVSDLADYGHFDSSRMQHDVSFVGYVGSAPERYAALKSLYDTPHRLRFLIRVRDEFFRRPKDSGSATEQRSEFLDSLRDSIAVLCPAGTGRNSVRFYETLSMGRTPVLISADRCKLPFASEVNYAECVVPIAARDAAATAEVLQSWFELEKPRLIERCKACRSIWELHFSRQAVVNRLTRELDRYRHARGPEIHVPYEGMRVLSDEMGLYERLKVQAEHFIAAEDDVNAIEILRSMRMILLAHGQPTLELEVAIGELREIFHHKTKCFAQDLAVREAARTLK